MANFPPALAHVFRWEGGEVAHANDRGGHTKYGIASASHPGIDIANLTRGQAADIYLDEYWHRLSLSEVNNQRVATKMFEVAVHFGDRGGAKIAQRAFNRLRERGPSLVVDGRIGPMSISAFNSVHPDSMVARIQVEQLSRFGFIVAADPTQRVFLKGWVNRALDDGGS